MAGSVRRYTAPLNTAFRISHAALQGDLAKADALNGNVDTHGIHHRKHAFESLARLTQHFGLSTIEANLTSRSGMETHLIFNPGDRNIVTCAIRPYRRAQK